MITHVEKAHSSLDEPITVFVMECGATCTADENGNLLPIGFDFYTRQWSFKANCRDCHKAIGRQTNENQRDSQRTRRKVAQ